MVCWLDNGSHVWVQHRDEVDFRRQADVSMETLGSRVVPHTFPVVTIQTDS
jgi:hypothetical protein